jgi:hypothetical protein
MPIAKDMVLSLLNHKYEHDNSRVEYVCANFDQALLNKGWLETNQETDPILGRHWYHFFTTTLTEEDEAEIKKLYLAQGWADVKIHHRDGVRVSLEEQMRTHGALVKVTLYLDKEPEPKWYWEVPDLPQGTYDWIGGNGEAPQARNRQTGVIYTAVKKEA